MVEGAYAGVLEHVGPWTEQDYLALPADRQRIELLDGSLLVSPSAGFRHQRLSFHLCYALAVAAPADLEVLEAINVRVAPGRILIPDLTVVSTPGADRTMAVPADVVMVVEITSPGNAVVDRALKPQLYAQAGIGHYLRVDQDEEGLGAVLYRRSRSSYLEVARARPGQTLVLIEPITVTLDLAALSAATHPPS